MKYSIISIAKNNLTGLIKTYSSIQSQIYKNYEWVVIDGDSTDGTQKWLKSLTENNIIWISEPDDGLYQAMNKGLNRSTGDYIIYMNSGDQFASIDVLKQVNAIIIASKEMPAFIYGDSIDETLQGKKLYYKSRSVQAIWKCMFTHHQAMFFSKHSSDKIIYDEKFKVCADYKYICELIMRLRKSGIEDKIIKVDFPICIFLLGGINETKRFRALFEDYSIRRDVLKQNLFIAGMLFILHFLHFCLKRIFPDHMRQLRYR